SLDAFDNYFQGRPKIDEIVIKFIPDQNTMVANLLSGAIDANLGRGLTNEQASKIEPRWRDGHVQYAKVASIHAWPGLEPSFASPAVIATDAKFRKALIYGINRQEMVDTLLPRSSVAVPWYSTDDADYPALEPSVVKYGYDPRQAAQLIEQVGYARGADGMYHDPAGKALSVELRTTTRINEASTISDYWKQI